MPVSSEDQGIFRRSIRLVIADPHPVVLRGLISTFAAQREFEIVASCSSGSSFLAAVRKLVPDIALFADTLPDLAAREILTIAKAENLPTQLVLFTEAEKEDDFTSAIASGACNAISKCASPETLLRSLRLMAEPVGVSPDPYPDLAPNGKESEAVKFEKMLATLTDREREIMRLVSGGLSNKEIARHLNVSQGTVKVHLHNIFQKLEINNRTVLAAIALLQRPVGFGTLSLAALAFATMSDVKASDADNTFLNDDGITYKDLEHSLFVHDVFEHLRHIDGLDHVETAALTQRGSSIGASHVTNPAGRIEEQRTGQQAVLSNFARGYGAVGSGTPVATGTLAATEVDKLANAFIAVASPTKSRGGYGTFTMTAAGVWIYMVDDSNAAVQALDHGQTLTDTFTVASLDGAPQVVTITIHGANDAAPQDFGNKALGAAGHKTDSPVFGILEHHEAAEGVNAGGVVTLGGGDHGFDVPRAAEVTEGLGIKGNSSGNTIYGAIGSDGLSGNSGNSTIIGGYGGDQRTDSKSKDAFVHLSAIDSNSTPFDTITDFVSGSNKINLAAFGALAFLHLTPSSTSVPPHTLAWIYNPASNETVVYVNPTDGSLDIGSTGLVEIHLQGIVSVVEADFVYEPHPAAVATALEGIDPALLVTAASDGTILTTGGVQASINAAVNDSSPATTGTWAMPADDGLRFHFGQHQIDSIASIKLAVFGDDPDHSAEANDHDAVTAPTHVSSIELASSHATILTEDQLTAKKHPTHAGADTTTIGHGKDHSAALIEPPELGLIPQNAPIGPAGAAVGDPNASTGNGAGHRNSQHPSNATIGKTAGAAELTESDLMAGSGGGHGNSQHPSNAATAKTADAAALTEADRTPGKAGGHGNSQHCSDGTTANSVAADGPTGMDVTTGNTSGHGNSDHPSNGTSANPAAATDGGHEQTFHFDRQVAASNAATVTPEKSVDQHILLDHGHELANILEPRLNSPEEHAASHLHDGEHHAKGHQSHDLLI